jgi:hypothetical protein
MVEPDRQHMAIRRMRFTCWITKTIDTHSQYLIFIAFQRQHDHANAPQCYVIRTLPNLLKKF